ncbi:hypothetical protein G0U57_020408 [Chelydra serpentina]|uniref:Ig-like domain-containing protein n=1 Tax=Chelydra serpentina TaxID=8475 RepID=A0A8T1S2U6_CHESE|nr:hypothetical protein G0U57_020408 [Chelydra serpentina]
MGATDSPTDSSDPFPFPGALPAPTLYLSQTSAQVGSSVQLQCSVFSRVPATRIVFCKDGEELLSQTGSEEKVTYDYDDKVSKSSTGDYACGYEIKDSNNRMNRSQLSSAQHLSVTGKEGERQSQYNCPCSGKERIHMQIAKQHMQISKG